MNCTHFVKRPNLKLKTRPKQLLGSLPLAFELPCTRKQFCIENESIIYECNDFFDKVTVKSEFAEFKTKRNHIGWQNVVGRFGIWHNVEAPI